MIVNCPFCQKLLNINGAVGTFVVGTVCIVEK